MNLKLKHTILRWYSKDVNKYIIYIIDNEYISDDGPADPFLSIQLAKLIEGRLFKLL